MTPRGLGASRVWRLALLGDAVAPVDDEALPGDVRRAGRAQPRDRAGDLVPFATFSDPVAHLLIYPNGDQVHAFALCFWVRVDDQVPK